MEDDPMTLPHSVSRPIALAAALLLGGGAVGAFAVALDADALGVLIPEQHQA